MTNFWSFLDLFSKSLISLISCSLFQSMNTFHVEDAMRTQHMPILKNTTLNSEMITKMYPLNGANKV